MVYVERSHFIFFLDETDASPSNNINILVGLIFSEAVPELTTTAGFGTSAGAIMIAFDRVRKERLLPGSHLR